MTGTASDPTLSVDEALAQKLKLIARLHLDNLQDRFLSFERLLLAELANKGPLPCFSTES